MMAREEANEEKNESWRKHCAFVLSFGTSECFSDFPGRSNITKTHSVSDYVFFDFDMHEKSLKCAVVSKDN